jgi:hypothetical protein
MADSLNVTSLVEFLVAEQVSVLGLETLVEIKRESKEPKDRLVLPILEATLKRSRGA